MDEKAVALAARASSSAPRRAADVRRRRMLGPGCLSSMPAIGIELMTAAKHKLVQRPAAEIAKAGIV